MYFVIKKPQSVTVQQLNFILGKRLKGKKKSSS